MEATIMVIGLKEKCKESESFMIPMEIYNIKENGKMTITMGKALSMGLMMWTGLNIQETLGQEKWKVLDRCTLRMEINIKDNSEAICHGEKEECF